MTQRWTLIFLAAFAGMVLLICAILALAIVFLDHYNQTMFDHLFSIMVLLFGCTFGLLLVACIYWRRIGGLRQPSNIWMRAGYVTSFALLGIAAVSWAAVGIISLILSTPLRSELMSGSIVLMVLIFTVPLPLMLIGRLQDARTRQQP